MGRAGGGGGGSHSSGGRSMGSRSTGGRSMGSRSTGGRSMGSSSMGGRSMGGSAGRSSMGGGHIGGMGGPGPHHTPPRSYHRTYHRPPRPVIITPGYGRRTVIINNGNTTTNTGSYNNGTAATQEYTASKPLTPEQKINRAERLAEEAREAKKGTMKIFFVAAILLVLGFFVCVSANKDSFEKINLFGTTNVGYATDELNGVSGTKLTRAACEEFYDATGIPLYFYTMKEYNGSDAAAYASELYDELFQDENHVLMVYYDNLDYWSWCVGGNVSAVMPDSEINALLDEIEYYWYDYSLSFDQVLAKGIKNYTKNLTSNDSGSLVFGRFLVVIGVIVAVAGVISYVNKEKEAKRYEEEVKQLRAEQILSKPLETFGNQDVEDLKDKYDNL